MLIPTKHEKLANNILVLGADVLFFIKKKSYNIEELFQRMKHVKDMGLEQYYNTITFLFLAGVITIENHRVSIKINK